MPITVIHPDQAVLKRFLVGLPFLWSHKKVQPWVRRTQNSEISR